MSPPINIESVRQAVCTILRYIGEDPEREGLRETPDRVIRSWSKLYGGYKQNARDILMTSFGESGRYDQMIVLGPIEFWSTCEHHMIPFYGAATVGYIPNEDCRVVGVSKLARCVEVYARRLQIQERMTTEIATAVQEATGARGVGVVVQAKHLCMVARGVEKQHSEMTTSAMLGAMKTNTDTRNEFLRFVERKGS